MMQIDSRLETTKRAHSVNETIYPSLLLRMLSDISHFLFFFFFFLPFLKENLVIPFLSLIFSSPTCVLSCKMSNKLSVWTSGTFQRQIIHTHIFSETWYPVKFKLKQQCPNPQSQEIRPLDMETKRDKSLRTQLWPICWE